MSLARARARTSELRPCAWQVPGWKVRCISCIFLCLFPPQSLTPRSCGSLSASLTSNVSKFLSPRYAMIGGRGMIRLVAGSSVITLKLSNSIRLILLFRGWYVRILLTFSSVDVFFARPWFETDVSSSQGLV